MKIVRTTLVFTILFALEACSGNGSTIGRPANQSSSAGHKVVQSSGKQWEIFPLPSGGSDPELMTIGPDNNVWFTEDAGNSIDQINVVTGVIARFPISDPNVDPQAISPGADGNIWFCEGSSARIGVMTPAGAYTSFPLPLACNDLTATSDGSLWANGGNDIQKISSTGVVTQYPIPSGRSAVELTVGSDGDVWFTEQQHCPPSCYNRRMLGKISLTGTITEYNWFHKHSSFYGDMVLGHDGNLYSLYGFDGKFAQIFPNGTVVEYGDTCAATSSVLIAGPPKVFFGLSFSGGLYEAAPTLRCKFLNWPSNGRDAQDMVFASDGNVWMTQPELNSIAVYLWHRIIPAPTSITVGVGGSQQLSIKEQNHEGGWQVVSTDPSIATVSMISQSLYNVTGVSSGSCSILITDAKGNQVAVPVAVTPK